MGAAGDFITAPEVSQIFGELIGLWCADLWQRMGRPIRSSLAELGPGRGTLMADLLRAASSVPNFAEALRLHLVEASPVLRASRATVWPPPTRVWRRRARRTAGGPLLLVANEFLDALPIRQLVRGRKDWGERLVAADASGALCFADSPESPALSLLAPPARREAMPGTVVEICPAAITLIAAVAERLTRHPGAALFID